MGDFKHVKKDGEAYRKWNKRAAHFSPYSPTSTQVADKDGGSLHFHLLYLPSTLPNPPNVELAWREQHSELACRVTFSAFLLWCLDNRQVLF